MFPTCTLIVIYLLFATVCATKPCAFECPENPEKCIALSSVCNGKRDCPLGGDETRDFCKPDSFVNGFSCAYGGKINQEFMCNRIAECADGSDESPRLCQEEPVFNKTRQGKCREDEVECMLGECIPVSKMCDDQHDCSNGRDESVDLCMVWCDDEHFRCANGKCLNKEEVCDNKFDCIDGSDELESVCSDDPKWEGKTPATCKEPKEMGLHFNGTYYQHPNQTRFVYANDKVQLLCDDTNAKRSGNEWNVCTYTGEWLHNLPVCKSKQKNYNPKTNGTEGCPINTYDENRMVIYKCRNNKCETEIKPPFNNTKVKFACKPGYKMVPIDFSEKEFYCKKNYKWAATLNNFTDPHCVKECSSDRLHCSDSMYPVCNYNDRTVNCDSSGLKLMPGTQANFVCNVGYRQNGSHLTLECQDDGTWSHEPNMDQFCQLDCGVIDEGKNPLAKNALTIKPRISPWSVAIYIKNESNNDFTFQCAGVRVKANVVLTVAHCVTNKITKTVFPADYIRVGDATSTSTRVGTNYGWAVEKVRAHTGYHPTQLSSDTALLKLKLTKAQKEIEEPKVICLPWEAKFKVHDVSLELGDVCTWDTTSKNELMNLTMVMASTSGRDSSNNIRIQTKYNHKICNGDSGSGFSYNCYAEHDTQLDQVCLYGIVSYANQGQDTDKCSETVVLTDTSNYNTRSFLRPTIKYMQRSCDADP